ncbi:Peroxisomal multifunctional enzyme type 2 (MFE-2) (17-beta-hydroxysteroid dehydrogenase 4) (17-beta-HSD 4) (D-bifunctional protein) (DBP) (Multifunctional protein 2) (MFP-2) (Short chain dehydrogenase/reductase family 8C member 1) [Cleaved into: (3R)-hydroxyacyl-CoA dehydrogenase [Durusdinium trenchii]|uniref:MaoC-like domain-containing protein n=1 Tax=Durusdinium trenchii TaxID=1381693 RepID=A0ABP0KYZ2_9DINO
MGDDKLVETEEYLNKWSEQKVSYNKRDLLTYAVGIGCDELNYVYEHDADFAAFPTYPIVLTFKGTDQDVVDFPSEAMSEGPSMPPLPGIKVGLDGERYIEKIAPLDVDGGELTVKSRIIGVHARGSGASVEKEELIMDSNGKVIYKIISGAFLVGAKGFKDSGITNSEKVDIPKRAPDSVLEMPTTKNQAQIYRLSGDYNPLHVDPGFATMSGFKEPILHGLCSLGITAHAVIKQYCDGQASGFKAIKGRFAKPVFPGDTLVVEMWKEGDKIIVQSKSKASGDVCINNAYILLNTGAKL